MQFVKWLSKLLRKQGQASKRTESSRYFAGRSVSYGLADVPTRK